MDVTVQETGFESGAAAVALDYIKMGHRDAGWVEYDLTDVAADVEVDFDPQHGITTAYAFLDGTVVLVEEGRAPYEVPWVVRQRIVTPPPKPRDFTKTYTMRVTQLVSVDLDPETAGPVWVEFQAIDESDGREYPVVARLTPQHHPCFGKGDRVTFTGDRVMLYAPLKAYGLRVDGI